MNIYVNIPGVKGSATDSNHKGQVPAMAYAFSKSRAVRMQVGYTSNRESGAPRFSYFELVKPIDISSPQIYQLFVTGKCLEKIIVQVCHTGQGGQVYHEFTLYNVMVADRTLSNVSDKLHTGLEYLTLSYTRLDEKFIPYDGQNKIGSPIITGYDLETAKAC